ncbi:Imelysin [Acetobacteraceae bacterium AT-5844]|nr:Imelysin [Acetobacteraceae bacterium AT-5844]
MHRRHLLFATPALLLAAPAWAAPDDASLRALNRAVVEGAILPGYRAFATATTNFAGALVALTKAPTEPAALGAARKGFADSMLAWQGVQHLRFGPADLFSRHQRIQFWPDPKDTVGEDLAEVIARRDASLLEVRPNALANITTLGLPAAERLLFGEEAAAKLAGADADAAYRAALLGTIGGTLAAIARDVMEGWTTGDNPYAVVIIEPRAPYAGPREATLELFRAMNSAVEAVGGRKLARALETSEPQALESWRSRLSGQNIAANIAAARQMYASGFAAVLERAGEKDLAAQLTQGFESATSAAAALPLPLEDALTDPARRGEVELLQQRARALRPLLGERLGAVLGAPAALGTPDPG